MKIIFQDLSLNRLFRVFNDYKNVSITRALELDFLRFKDFKGSILDFGGGKKSNYLNYLSISISDYESINIDPSIEPTYVVSQKEVIDINKKYDHVISINTIEHVISPESVLSNINRLVKKDGQIMIITPFIYSIHAHPDDYIRPTPSWYYEKLKDQFYDIKCTSISWGALTSAASISSLPGPFKRARLLKAMLFDLILFKINVKRKENYKKELSNVSLAFCIEAKKS